MAASLFRAREGVQIDGSAVTTDIINGSVDPSAASGVAANEGSLYQRNPGGADDAELWLKYGDADTEWALIASGTGGSAELGYIRTFIGKTGSGSEMPTYSSTDVVAQSSNLETAIGALDAEIGAAVATAQSRTAGPISDQEVNDNIEALDDAIGADVTPVTRTNNSILLAANSANANIDLLDAAIGDDVVPTTRTVGPLVNSNDVGANLEALDTAVGTDAQLTALTRTVGPVATSQSVNENIDDLDTAIGSDAQISAVSRTAGPISTSQSVNENLDDLDAAVGADTTPVTRTNNSPITAANSANANIDALDTAIGDDVVANSRTVGPIVNSNDVGANLEALDDAIGTDAQISAVSRTTGPISTAQSVNENIDDLDAAIGNDVVPTSRTVGPLVAANDVGANLEALDTAIGIDSNFTTPTYISTANNVNENLDALDNQVKTNEDAITALEVGLRWLEGVEIITADDLSARSGTGDNTFSDNNGSAPTLQVGDRIASTNDDVIYIVQAGSWTTASALVAGDIFHTNLTYTDPVNQENGSAWVFNTSLSKAADFDFELANSINLSGSYAAANGTVSASDTVEAAVQYLDGNQLDLTTLSGSAQGATNHGTFTGDVIADSETTKGALQDLEDELGTDAQLTAVTRTNNNPVSTSNTKNQNIDALDAAIGDDVVPNSRTVGPIVNSNDVGANLEALDDAIGTDAQLTALTRTVGPVATSQSVNENIDDLDTAIGSDAQISAVSRTAGPIATSQSVNENLDDLDAAIGADTTPVTRTNNSPIVAANAVNANIDLLDAAIGDDVVPTTRTVGPLVNSNDVGANLEALDTAVGTDAQLTALSRTVGPVATSQSVNENIDDLDAAIGADVTNSQYIATSNSVNGNIDALDAVAEKMRVETTKNAVTTVQTLDSVPVDDYDVVKWIVQATEVANPNKKEAEEILAIHDGTASADATAVDYTEYALLRSTASPISGLTFTVTLDGEAGASQDMILTVSSTASVNVKAIRLVV